MMSPPVGTDKKVAIYSGIGKEHSMESCSHGVIGRRESCLTDWVGSLRVIVAGMVEWPVVIAILVGAWAIVDIVAFPLSKSSEVTTSMFSSKRVLLLSRRQDFPTSE
eukprot:8541449-Ditylum_brightwellii.AAC.1